MKYFIKIDRSTIRLNPDYSLTEQIIPTTLEASFVVTDPKVLNGDFPELEVIYPEFKKDVNYFITESGFDDNGMVCNGVFMNGEIPMSGKKFDGIEITVTQNYTTIYPDTRRFLYEYEETPDPVVKCETCSSTFKFRYMEDDCCPVCDIYVDHDIEIEYEQFNENMIDEKFRN